MDLNTVVHGVVHGRIHIPAEQQKIISVIVGEKEFKWLLEDIFKKPGLMRKKTIGVTSETETLRLPWRFFTNEHADPATYGYRTVIVERYYASGSCRSSVDDEAMFHEEVDWAGDDVHRGHRPLRVGRLVDSNQNVDLSSAWKVDKTPHNPGEGVPHYTMQVDRAPPHSIQSPLYVPSAVGVMEESRSRPAMLVNCDVENGVEIRSKPRHEEYTAGDTSPIIRTNVSDDYEANSSVEIRLSKSRTNEADVSPEIRQYSPIGEDGKCKTYRPRSALSGGRVSEHEADSRNKSYQPQSALSGHISDQESDGQVKTYRPRSALSGRISEKDVDDSRNEEKREMVSRMPDLLLYSTPKTEIIQQQQYRNSEVPYAPRPVGLENEFNRSDTLQSSGGNNRMSLQEGPVVTRPEPRPVSRTPSGKIPPQPPVRKTPYVGEPRTSIEIHPEPAYVVEKYVVSEVPARTTQHVVVPEHRFVSETFPETLITSSPVVPNTPVRTLPYPRDQRIISEVFTEDVHSSPADWRNTSSARAVSMISPVSSEQSYVISGRTPVKPAIQHPKPVINPVATALRVRSLPPPVPPKKKLTSASIASPEIITPPIEAHQGFMNFNDFLNVVRINDGPVVEPPSGTRPENASSSSRQSHASNTPPPSTMPLLTTPLSTTANQNTPIQVGTINSKTNTKSDGTFLDFNNFLHILHDPSNPTSNVNGSSGIKDGASPAIGVSGNGNRDVDVGTRTKSYVFVNDTPNPAVQPTQVRDSFVPTGEETVYTTVTTHHVAGPGEYPVVYRDTLYHPTTPAAQDPEDCAIPGVLISDL